MSILSKSYHVHCDADLFLQIIVLSRSEAWPAFKYQIDSVLCLDPQNVARGSCKLQVDMR